MAVTVTDADVRELITTEIVDLTPYITMATNIVTTYILPGALAASILDLVVRFLAAHIIVLTDEEKGGLVSERISDVEQHYSQPFGSKVSGFGTTRFGQQALALDTTGALKKMSNPDKLLNSAYIRIKFPRSTSRGCRELW